jgi:hemolysin activation/secretion protein
MMSRNSKNNIKISLLFSTSLVAAFSAGTALAQNVPSSVNPAKLEQRFEQKQPSLPPSRLAPVQAPDSQLPDSVKQQLAKKRFVLKSVVVEGNTVYSNEALKSSYSDMLGKEVSMLDAQSIARRITDQYRRDQFILSQAIIPPQEIKNGVLKVRVIEGYISDVRVEGDTKYGNIINQYGEQIKKQRPIKTSDLERYLLLMDDLPGSTAKGLVRPSPTQPGAAELVVTLELKKFEGSYTLDNRGSKFVGPNQHTATFAANSIFGVYDRTTVRVITTSPTTELRFIDLQHEQQVGKEGTRLVFTGSYSHSEPGDSLKILDIHADSTFFQVKVLHPFQRSRQENLVGRAIFDVRNTETDVFGNTNLSEDRLRVVRLGGSYDFADKLFGVNLIDAQVSHGLDVFGATDDNDNESRSDAEHPFTKFNLDVTRTQALPRGFSIFTAASAQYSLDRLLAAEQFSIGGAAFGSAYDPSELSGDHGIAGRVELRYGQALGDPFLNSYQVYGFYDIGRVWVEDAGAGGNDKMSLASAGLGLRTNFSEHFSGDFQVADPLTKEVNNQGGHAKSPRLFFSLIGRF